MKRFLRMDLTRRRLLRLAGVAGGSLLLGGGCGTADDVERTHPGDSDTSNETSPAGAANLPLQRAIREHFAYLTIDDPVIEAFARDLHQHQGIWSPETSPRPYTRFLASTDFFQNGANEARPLSYVAFYDPYVTACYNPFEASGKG